MQNLQNLKRIALRVRRLAFVMCALTLLTACSRSHDLTELKDWTEEQYKDRKPAVEPLPVIIPYENYTYTASNQSDPFSANNLARSKPKPTASGISPDTNRRREVLEQYPLDSIAMVGTLFKDDVSWVILQAPDGTIHRAKQGNHVGQNYGEIVNITEEQIAIRELINGPNGNWIERGATIAADGG